MMNLSKDHQTRLASRINELRLTIKGTHLEALISQLHREMEKSGISFKPDAYLTDGWGCPNRVPVIGIPFYLADPTLSRQISQLLGTRVEDDAGLMALLRHEAGHTFNYAYHLYRKPRWRTLFGRFSNPYPDSYTPIPFSPNYVIHLSGWYAQRHPDDDFAETFAVWLTPESEWRRRYSNTPALAKLLYIEEMVHKYGRQPPKVTSGKLDVPVEEMTLTLKEWIQRRSDS